MDGREMRDKKKKGEKRDGRDGNNEKRRGTKREREWGETKRDGKE